MPKKHSKTKKTKGQKVSPSEPLKQFVDRLVEEKGLAGTEPAVLKQIKTDLQDSLERRINAALVTKLPQEKLPEFEKLLDKGNMEKIQVFFQKNIPNLPEVLASEFLSFRKTYLEV